MIALIMKYLAAKLKPGTLLVQHTVYPNHGLFYYFIFANDVEEEFLSFRMLHYNDQDKKWFTKEMDHRDWDRWIKNMTLFYNNEFELYVPGQK